MFVKSLSLQVALAACAALTAGCSESLVSAPRVPVPVLLGPIDRVGGHHGEGNVVAPFAVEIGDFAAMTRSQQQVGTLIRTKTATSARHDGAAKLSVLILSATDAQHDRDVRIRRVGTGAWVWLTPDLASMRRSEWLDVDATVTAEQAR